MALSPSRQHTLITLLSWPKSDITTAAQLLARLKNRSHRHPSLSRAAFGASVHAVKIIATEYNVGGSETREVPPGDVRTSGAGPSAATAKRHTSTEAPIAPLSTTSTRLIHRRPTRPFRNGT
jgi:hypothetical protein